MIITIQDYNGYNSQCETVKKTLKYIQKKKKCSMDDIFKKLEFSYSDVFKVLQYLNENKKQEFKEYALKKFSFEKVFEEHCIKLNELKVEKENAIAEIQRINDLVPARIYSYFKNCQKYTTQGVHESNLHSILCSLLATITFKEGDYLQLQNVLGYFNQYHGSAEYHYRIAIENNNNSAWKEIEKYLNRKPYIVDGKRCYDGFEFQISKNEYYACTGWNSDGRIKFIRSTENDRKGQRKLLNFNYEEFKEYFKDKKMYKCSNFYL